MIEGLIECLLPKISDLNHHLHHLNPNSDESNLIIVLYLISSARTRIMGLSFFIAELAGATYGFGIYSDASHIYIGSAIISAYFARIQLCKTESCGIAVCCLVLICLYGYAAYDAKYFQDTKTSFYNAYPSILLCIHVCIILSFYNLKPLYDSMVNQLHAFWQLLRGNYTA